VEPSKTSLAAYLEKWLSHVERSIAPRTFERYQEIACKNLVPLLGQIFLTKLRPEQIAAAYARTLKTGRRDGAGGLSPRTVRHLHRVLTQAAAVRWRILTYNPVDAVDPPKVERNSMAALNPSETARLLAQFRGTRMFVPVLLAAACGLRRGEIAALRWASIDLSRRQLSVLESAERFKETKSGPARTVTLPTLVVEELRLARLRQAEELLRVGVRLSDQNHLVAQLGRPALQPNSLTHEFVRLLGKSLTLPKIRFHDLRRTHVAHLLASGTHPKVAQERLGHSGVGITLDLYSHVLPGMQEDAAAKVDAVIRSAIDGS
jgi:integrase